MVLAEYWKTSVYFFLVHTLCTYKYSYQVNDLSIFEILPIGVIEKESKKTDEKGTVRAGKVCNKKK